MGKTVEFALNVVEGPTKRSKKTSSIQIGVFKQGEQHPQWRGAGYREPNNKNSHLQEDTAKLALIQIDDYKKPYVEVQIIYIQT